MSTKIATICLEKPTKAIVFIVCRTIGKSSVTGVFLCSIRPLSRHSVCNRHYCLAVFDKTADAFTRINALPEERAEYCWADFFSHLMLL